MLPSSTKALSYGNLQDIVIIGWLSLETRTFRLLSSQSPNIIETPEDNTPGLLTVSDRRLSLLRYVVSGLWIGGGGFRRIEVCAVRLLSRRDHSNVVLGPGEIRDVLHIPVREVVIGQDRKAGVGAASDNSRFVRHWSGIDRRRSRERKDTFSFTSCLHTRL